VLRAGYRPLLRFSLRHPWVIAGLALAGLLSTLLPLQQTGTEFMPELDEGDLMYMPTTLPGISAGKARQLLQQTDALISSHPEVERVFGKVGRAETATDPAPMTMIETFITLKPKDEWREGVTTRDIINELDAMVQFPGVTNAWVFPIQARIDMLATGIRTDLGIGVTGPDLSVIEDIGTEIEAVVAGMDGVRSVSADRAASGRYVDIDIDRRAAARHGMNIDDVHTFVRHAIGGANVGQSVEGLERFPINLRYPRDWRDSPEQLEELPVMTPAGRHVALGELADVSIDSGPAMIRTENARPTGLVYVEIGDRALSDFVAEAKQRVAESVDLPGGYSLFWGGQYAYMERAMERLSLLVPLVMVMIVGLLMLAFRRVTDVVLALTVVPLSLSGGFWLLWLLGFDLSVGVGVGFIALGGLAAEIGGIMMVYLNQALDQWRERTASEQTRVALRECITDSALRRVRPITMTQATVFLGLLPVMLGSATGSEVMQRIAAPMVGGVFTVWLAGLLILPAVFYLWHGRRGG
jgi:Cu(I)/Ag(I) efflux system membrane protein CusA/SilA